jgi:hypothetical protein
MEPIKQPRGVSTRLKQLEEEFQHSKLSPQNSVRKTGNAFLQELQEKKEKRIEDTMNRVEEQYYTEISKSYDLTKKNDLFTQIVRATVLFVSENSVKIAEVIGSAFVGSMRFDLCISLLKNLFDDISAPLLGTIVQHTYDLTYKKHGDQRTLNCLEKQVKDLKLSNLPEDEKKASEATNQSIPQSKRGSGKSHTGGCVLL